MPECTLNGYALKAAREYPGRTHGTARKRMPDKEATGLSTPRRGTAVVAVSRVPERETQKNTTACRGSAVMPAIAKGKSAEDVIGEKSVG